jgi:hypothetical protein
MSRTAYGDCIGCDQPIRPPYLSFAVMRLEQERGADPIVHSWDEVDVCADCSAKLTADDLYRLVNDAEDEGGMVRCECDADVDTSTFGECHECGRAVG